MRVGRAAQSHVRTKRQPSASSPPPRVAPPQHFSDGRTAGRGGRQAQPPPPPCVRINRHGSVSIQMNAADRERIVQTVNTARSPPAPPAGPPPASPPVQRERRRGGAAPQVQHLPRALIEQEHQAELDVLKLELREMDLKRRVEIEKLQRECETLRVGRAKDRQQARARESERLSKQRDAAARALEEEQADAANRLHAETCNGKQILALGKEEHRRALAQRESALQGVRAELTRRDAASQREIAALRARCDERAAEARDASARAQKMEQKLASQRALFARLERETDLRVEARCREFEATLYARVDAERQHAAAREQARHAQQQRQMPAPQIQPIALPTSPPPPPQLLQQQRGAAPPQSSVRVSRHGSVSIGSAPPAVARSVAAPPLPLPLPQPLLTPAPASGAGAAPRPWSPNPPLSPVIRAAEEPPSLNPNAVAADIRSLMQQIRSAAPPRALAPAPAQQHLLYEFQERGEGQRSNAQGLDLATIARTSSSSSTLNFAMGLY